MEMYSLHPITIAMNQKYSNLISVELNVSFNVGHKQGGQIGRIFA
jgi:hypothetical protein